VETIEDLSRRVILLDVADAEALARPYLHDVVGLDRLKVSDSFHGFGGLASAPAISLRGVDKMSPSEKLVWIACRLWAICQKIKQVKSIPPKAGQLLSEYKSWLVRLDARKSKGASGGRQPAPYTYDLDNLIQRIIDSEVGSAPSSIKAAVFTQLPGEHRGVIEEITHERIDGKHLLSICWSSNDAGNPERSQLLGRNAVDKRVAKLLSLRT
jgi:hypothetical protein